MIVRGLINIDYFKVDVSEFECLKNLCAKIKRDIDDDERDIARCDTDRTFELRS